MRPAVRGKRGFTLIELIVIMAIIGLLVGVAIPTYRQSQRKAREAVLQENLFILRQTIDQYFADKGFYPASVEALVDDGYLRKVPVDPITGEDNWEEIPADSETSLDSSQPAGIWDVRSFADGETREGVPYAEL